MFSHNGEAKVPARQNLVKKYLPIGPAAIVAAVAAMEKRKATSRNRPTGHKRPSSIVRGRASRH